MAVHQFRIGIHSGPFMAGVVGTKKFAYDVWGDTVNTASRMESSGHTGEVNVSEATYNLLNLYFEFEYRGEIDAKNKGKIKMYFIKHIKPEYSTNGEGFIPNEKLLSLMR
jgi:class 3 adenylate cyclase